MEPKTTQASLADLLKQKKHQLYLAETEEKPKEELLALYKEIKELQYQLVVSTHKKPRRDI